MSDTGPGHGRESFELAALDVSRDLDPVARLISLAFAGPVEGCKQWMEVGGYENLRVVRGAGGVPEACLLRIPMGQYYGGRSVPCIGIAGVAVAPECRGKGLAREMMRRTVRAAAEEGTALLALYASTQTLYRQVGFEQAGSRFRIRVPMTALDVRERGGEIVALGGTNDPAVRACYASFAAGFDGMLDRGEYIWRRIASNRGVESRGFGVRSAQGTLDGYLFMNQQRQESGRQEIVLTDLAYNTPAAARRLLGFLADFGAIADVLEFFGGPSHPALMLLGQQRYTVALKDFWLIRVTDVVRALEARGYNPAARGEVHLQVEDPLVERNSGPWVLRVQDGKGTVTPGGRGEVRVGPRGLAGLYSGFCGVGGLLGAGLCEGPERALAMADGLLASRGAWMTDFF